MEATGKIENSVGPLHNNEMYSYLCKRMKTEGKRGIDTIIAFS